MFFPKLIEAAKTPVRVVIEATETNEFGERQTLIDKNFRCNYQDTATVKHTKEKQTPGVTGTIYIDGDILPGEAVISSGYVEVFGSRREIASGQKARNLDGSVNFTRLDVI